MTLHEPYLYCGICFKKSSEKRQYLTSCAHVICQDHINLSSKICPKCQVQDISIVKLEEDKIPNSIKEIIEPSFEQLSNIQFASKFQYVQMKVLIEEYEHQNEYLKEKNNRLKDLLRKSRVELDKCNEYQKEINRLKEENKQLILKIKESNSDNNINSNIQSYEDEINEITMDEFRSSTSGTTGISNNLKKINNNKNSNKENEDFMSKMKKFNQLKRIEELKSNVITTNNIKNNHNMKNDEPPPLLPAAPKLKLISKNNEKINGIKSNFNIITNNLNDEYSNLSSSFNIQAESTGIKKKRTRSTSLQINDDNNLSNNSLNNKVNNILGNKSPNIIGISSTAGNDNGIGVRKSWYKRRNEYYDNTISGSGSGSDNNITSESDDNSNRMNFSRNNSKKRMFSFKPPTRSVSSRTGLRMNNGSETSSVINKSRNGVGVLRSRNDIFRR